MMVKVRWFWVYCYGAYVGVGIADRKLFFTWHFFPFLLPATIFFIYYIEVGIILFNPFSNVETATRSDDVASLYLMIMEKSNQLGSFVKATQSSFLKITKMGMVCGVDPDEFLLYAKWREEVVTKHTIAKLA